MDKKGGVLSRPHAFLNARRCRQRTGKTAGVFRKNAGRSPAGIPSRLCAAGRSPCAYSDSMRRASPGSPGSKQTPYRGSIPRSAVRRMLSAVNSTAVRMAASRSFE